MIIYDLQGNVVDTLQEEEVGLGAGSLDWDEDLPAEDGIYTYKIAVSHDDDPPTAATCGDCDKSPRLTISNVSVSDFTWSQTRYPDYAFVTLHYTLTGQADGVDVECYAPGLSTSDIGYPSSFPATAGTNDVLVEFAVDRTKMGPYRFVVSATEDSIGASGNRDGLPKPALPKGAAQVIWAPASGVLGGQLTEAPWTLAQIVSLMGASDVFGTHYASTGDTSGTALAARQKLLAGGVVLLFAHSNSSLMSFDNGQGSLVSDLIGGSGTDDSNADNYYVENFPDDLDHVLFALCAGCETAGSGSWSTTSVPAEILEKGGQSAIGFLSEIYVPQTWTFVHEFFDVTTSDIPVDTAAAAALDEVWDVHGSYGGLDSWHRAGGNVSLRPARFGG